MNDDALNQFNRHFSQQNWEAAQEVVQDAIRQSPSDWNAIYLSGVIRRFQGDFHGAIALYKRALQLSGDVASIWSALGIVYQQSRDYPSALHALSRADELEPDNYETHTSLGITYSLAGENDAAIRSHTQAMELCVDWAFSELLREREKYFSIKVEADRRVFSLTPEYFTAMKETLATDFRYFNSIKNLAACYSDIGDHQRAGELIEHADTCTPIEADLIGPIKRSSR